MVHATKVKGAALWETKRILVDGKNIGDSDSLALGCWDGQPCLGSRYDRRDGQKDEIGFPFVFGNPAWFVLPAWMEAAVLNVAPISEHSRSEAFAFLRAGSDGCKGLSK